MYPFPLGSLVRPKPDVKNYVTDAVIEAFKSTDKPPIGVIKSYYRDFRVFVDWSIEQHPFHVDGVNFSLHRPTGFWVDTEFLELAYEPYNPDQEEEDDCL